MDIFRRPSLQITPPADKQQHPASTWFGSTRSPSTTSKQGIEHRAHSLAKPSGQPAISEDLEEDGQNANNFNNDNNPSTLSLSSDDYMPAASETGPRRVTGTRSMELAASDDDFVRVHKPSSTSAFVPSSANGSPHTPHRNSTSNIREPSKHRRQQSDPSNVTPLTSLYLVSGLPKSPQTWTLADHDSVAGVHHSEAAVGRWWRAEVLGSTVSPGVGGSKKRKGKGSKASTKGGVFVDTTEGKAGLGKGDLAKMLSKSLKLSFPREVEIIASTLQPASTIHTFTFSVPNSTSSLPSGQNHTTDYRSSVFSSVSNATAGDRSSAAFSQYNYNPYIDPTLPRPSSTYLGPPGGIVGGGGSTSRQQAQAAVASEKANITTYHGVCLTVWSHADEERSAAIRRTLETAASARRRRNTKVSMSSIATSVAGASSINGGGGGLSVNGAVSGRARKKSGPWSGTDAEESETDAGGLSESDADGLSSFGGNANGAGASTLFLPQNTVFWLPYALTLVSRHPIYDLMRDYLTLSWARFSKDVQSHTLQIAKILEHPAPRSGDIVRLDAGAGGESIEVVCRFPGGLDFGRGLVDVNFTMWPLFRCLNLDNILTLCEIALAPTGRVLFLSRHPAMLGIAVATLKYLVELRGWSGVALPNIHARDAKIYIEDPGPWIIAMSTESRYCVRIHPEVCVCDLDINYVNCASPPVGAVSIKQQRDKFRKVLMGAFDSYFHPDHGVPSEFKEAFPAGRFRPLCKIQSKRGSSIIAESIRPPSWWHQTRVIGAFDAVLKEKVKRPSLIKRISHLGTAKKQPYKLSAAELLIQLSIRKRATAFVDARDDLETKIGRLSRRLNFLMTESELWRQKFVAFEGYAEKLSAEAAELRGKIGKEQRESKRLSGLVSVTAHEKTMLTARLADTEEKHREALVELEKMRVDMDEMEHERARMVAEVEAQIERALASMALSDNDDSDYSQMSRTSSYSLRAGGGGGRPGSAGGMSRRGSASAAHLDRPNSATGHDGSRPLRSFATASTLAGDMSIIRPHAVREDDGEAPPEGADDTMVITGEGEETSSPSKGKGKAKEEVEEDDADEKARKRFSATNREAHMDGLTAMDEGISHKSDLVAQKVLAIQQKLDNALAHTRQTRARSLSSRGSKSEVTSADETVARPPSRARPPRAHRFAEPPVPRIRTQSNMSRGDRPSTAPAETTGLKALSPGPVASSTHYQADNDHNDHVDEDDEYNTVTLPTAQPRPHLRQISSGASLSATRPPPPDPIQTTRQQPPHHPWGRHQHVASATSSYTSVHTPAVTMDDSDDSYMSAYSYSPGDGGFAGRHGDGGSGDDGSADELGAYDPEGVLMNRFRSIPSHNSLVGGSESLLGHDVAAEFGKAGQHHHVHLRPNSRSSGRGGGRERAESTATARGKAAALEAAAKAAEVVELGRAQGSPTISEFSTHSVMRITGTAM